MSKSCRSLAIKSKQTGKPTQLFEVFAFGNKWSQHSIDNWSYWMIEKHSQKVSLLICSIFIWLCAVAFLAKNIRLRDASTPLLWMSRPNIVERFEPVHQAFIFLLNIIWEEGLVSWWIFQLNMLFWFWSNFFTFHAQHHILIRDFKAYLTHTYYISISTLQVLILS